jgi:multidrug resistance efflux pump
MKNIFIGLILIGIVSCKDTNEKYKPSYGSITESVYASGIIKSESQYNVFANVSGTIKEIHVKEGDLVSKGSPLISISNDISRYNLENAELNAQFSDFGSNQNKLNDAKKFEELQFSKMKLDSTMFERQKSLWNQDIGTKVELEQKELNYKNSLLSYQSAKVKYEDLKRQIRLSSNQSKNQLNISKKMESDFTIKSEINGMVFGLQKEIGEMISPQTPLATIGNPNNYILEMQVDENDIFRIEIGQTVYVKMDSYKGKVFEAKISKISPIMNERTKTFLVDAAFTKKPEKLYPFTTFEANIVIKTREKVLLIPRNLLINDSMVLNTNGDYIQIKTGLMDFQKVEVISGIGESEELIFPKK